MILYIVRHADAYQSNDPRWPNDAQRPLSPKGRRRFKATVKKLADRGLAPQVIATSPLERCRQTAEVLAKNVCGEPEIIECEALQPGSDLAAMLRWTADRSGQERIAWVGHAPDVTHLAGGLVAKGEAQIDFRKGAIAAIEFDGPPAAGMGSLAWLITAEVLGAK